MGVGQVGRGWDGWGVGGLYVSTHRLVYIYILFYFLRVTARA